MQFSLIARDNPGALEKRLAARAEHMEGVKRGKTEGWIIDGGALLDEDGQMCGSSMLLEFPDRASLDTYVASEVYQRSGVWGDVTILPMRRVDWNKLMGASVD
jgi:uncharacterized protein YciI